MILNKFVISTLLLTGCILSCAAQLDLKLKGIAQPEDVDKKTTSTTTTTTTIAPPESTTTTTTTTSTTTTTTTTTAAPETTTTTMKPNTTTVAPITTTPAPAPYPDPSIGQWNASCILVKMATQLNFTYETKDKKSTNVLYNIPANAKVQYNHCNAYIQLLLIIWGPVEAQNSMLLKFDLKFGATFKLSLIRFIIRIIGDQFPNALDKNTTTALYNIPTDPTESRVADADCSEIHQSVDIKWGPDTAKSSMVLQFDLKDSTVELTMMHFTIALTADRFPNALENQTIQLLYRGDIFDSPLKMSYHCTRAQHFNLTETVEEKNITGTVTIRDVQVEAFRKNANSTAFSSARDCDSSNTSDIVPIAVGIALAALIGIVLIAYLCARRRSTSRGYMSF